MRPIDHPATGAIAVSGLASVGLELEALRSRARGCSRTCVPDLAAGDVHVREGAIVAVARTIEASAAQVIDGAGMICIPGFVDTHFHLWNALFRLFVRADVPALGYFPVTARLGPLMGPEDRYRSVRLGAAEAPFVSSCSR